MRGKFIKKKIVLIVMIFFCIFTGCSINTSNNLKNKTINTVNKEIKKENHITYKYEKITNDKKNDQGKELLKWSYSYPVFTYSDKSETADKINNFIKSKVEDFDKSVRNDNSKLLDKNIDISGYIGLPYGGNYEVAVKRCDNKVISLELTQSIFGGGAHSNETYRGITFNAVTGEQIKFEDLSEKRMQLYDNITNYLDRLIIQPYYKSKINDDYKIEMMSFVKSDKWYLSDGGIVFMTDPYEAACYAEGSVEFTVPYENISEIKKSYSYDGSYRLHLRTDYDVNKDINGDGKNDDIVVQGRNNKPIDIKINEYNLAEQLYGIDFTGYESLDYFIVDLDDKDKYKEIAVEVRKKRTISDSGIRLNDFQGKTYFFRYKGKSNLECLGYIDKLISDVTVDYKNEKMNSVVKNISTDKISIEEGKKIIREKDKDLREDYTIEYATDYKASQFGIPEETYLYYTYNDMAAGSVYMVGVKSKNLYIGPTNGMAYFDLYKDGKSVKRYELKK